MMKRNTIFSIAIAVTLGLPAATFAQMGYHMQAVPIQSRWAKEVSPINALKEYPRSQLVRANWENLNGLWDYAITAKDVEQPLKYDGQILVPYPVESALSNVKKALLPEQNLWYKRTFAGSGKGKTLLHFGAVDWQAIIYINGKEAGQHTGGYTEFAIDITDKIKPGQNELMIKVYDPSDRGIGPHGKQVLNPANIYYTPTSGIWQTVWLESVPEDYIESLTITPDIDQSVVKITVNSTSKKPVTVVVDGLLYKGEANCVLSVPVKNQKLWSPSNPYLYTFTAKLGTDEVKSYFGMRKISIGKDEKGVDRIMLNNKPYYNLGVLDQGFWPDGLYTAPTDEALAFDIKAIKVMGFNTIRKHIKVEPARWYYHADRIGMLVWQDMVNPNQGLPEGAKQAFEQQCKETLAQLHNYPSITTWVLFNEKWGQYDQQRLTEWIKTTDPSRIINGHTGELLYVNEQLRSPSPNAYVSADMTDVHSYPDPMMPIKQDHKAQVLGEFGGIGVFIADHQWNTNSAWGYIQEKPAGLLAKYKIMTQHLQLLQKEGLSGSIYTQPFDVEGEQNGLMTYDREIAKMPFAELRKIHSKLNPDANINIPSVTAKDADLTEPGLKYSDQLQLYIDGNREPKFLKKLGMMATQVGDKPGVALASSAYIQTLKKPFSKDDIGYILQVTNSTKDAGFAFIQNNEQEVDSQLGPRQAEVKLMNIIYKEDIQPEVSNPIGQPDWEALSKKIAPYGTAGEEILLRAKFFHYLNKQDWPNFVASGDAYIGKYGQNLSAEELNNWAWMVYEKVTEPKLLLSAAEWSRLSVKDKQDPNMLDTQASLLYKAGKKAEGIAIEEKAVSLSGSPEIKANLERMKAGQTSQ